MWVERCNNHRCRRPYQVNEFDGERKGQPQPADITCPHCGFSEVRWSESVFLTHALSSEQEQEINQRQGYIGALKRRASRHPIVALR